MNRVLVLMSTYNGEKYLINQIESILSQKNCKVTLLVRDDGSSDETIEILKKYESQNKLKYHIGDNMGPANSFMHLLSHADDSYDYYAFSDQDDIWNEDKLEVAIRLLECSVGPAMYCGNAKLVDRDLNEIGICNTYVPEFNLVGVLMGGGPQGATIVMNKALASLFANFGNIDFCMMHDYFVSAVCLAVGGTIHYDKEPHICYRQHENNVLGVKKNFITTIKNRIDIVRNTSGKYDVIGLCQQILNNYNQLISGEVRDELLEIISYKNTLQNRIKIAKKKGVGNGRKNIAFFVRIAILLGNM